MGEASGPRRGLGPRGRPAVAVALLALATVAVAARGSTTLSDEGPFARDRVAVLSLGAALFVVVLACAGLILSMRRQRGGLWQEARRRRNSSPFARGLTVLTLCLVLVVVWTLVARRWFDDSARTPEPPSPPPPDGSAGSTTEGAAVALLVVAALILAFVPLLLRTVERRRHHRPTRPEPDEDDAWALERAVSAAHKVLYSSGADLDETRQAIVGCYAAMERALGDVGTPGRASDTPQELMDRAVTAGLVRAGPAARLTHVFEEARFSSHPMGHRQRSEAGGALREILTDLRGQ